MISGSRLCFFGSGSGPMHKIAECSNKMIMIFSLGHSHNAINKLVYMTEHCFGNATRAEPEHNNFLLFFALLVQRRFCFQLHWAQNM